MPEITPNDDQQEGLDKISTWLDDPNAAQTFALGGLAGTGKSTIIPHAMRIARAKGFDTAIAAPTGKAVSVINKKFGRQVASTIHRLVYTPVDERKSGRLDLLGREEYEPVVAEGGEVGDKVLFIDEASMVNEATYYRLLDVADRICFIGDHGQLPPVKEGRSLSLRNLDHELTQIMRQRGDSPILDFAYDVRGGGSLNRPPKGVWHHRFRTLHDIADCAAEHGADLVIAASNKIRHTVSQRMRSSLGFSGKYPQEGERIIALATFYGGGDRDVFNG